MMEKVEDANAEDLSYIVQAIDVNCDGEISFEEFQNFFDVVLLQSSIRAGN
jgi:Ca2+-binding EF-hand superfamily protein